jgi:hypothetical protein
MRDALFGHEARALEMLLEGASAISRTLGYDATTESYVMIRTGL